MANGVDIAELGLRVDAREAREGTAALRELEQQGARTERRFMTLAEFDARRARTSAINTRALRERAQTEREVAALMNQTATATDNVATKSRLAGAPIARLNNSMVVLARQAAGAHPVVGQLSDAIGTFAIGTARMVPVLAGLAAVAGGINLITRESREAKKALEEQLNVLREIARERDIEARGGTTRIALAAGRAEASGIAAALRGGPADVSLGTMFTPAGGATPQQLLERLREQNKLNQAAQALLEEQERAERAAERRRRMRVRNQVESATSADRLRRLREIGTIRPRDLSEDIAADQAAFEARLRQAQFETDIAGGFTLSRVQAAPGSGVAAGIGQQQYEEQQARRLRAEQELADARLRANDALVRSLENVGRAYGGVADQVLALTAAVLSLERMPLLSREDRGKAFGTAALTGIGIGASTGSPILGGLGGAGAGFMTAGPIGAIVGGVSGIVSGLIESGRRAEQARLIWRNALEDFALLFDEITPQIQLDRAFQQLSGGLTTDEVRKRIEELEKVRQTFASTGQTHIIDQEIRRLQELLEIYGENADQASKLAEAERDLYDARFRALNAPSGFNLAYFGWQAGAGFVPPPGAGGGGMGGRGIGDIPGEPEPIIVNVMLDGEVIYTEVQRRQGGAALRGGPSPLDATER